MGYIKCNEIQKIIEDEIIQPSCDGVAKPSQYVYNCARRLQDIINEIGNQAFNDGCVFEADALGRDRN